MTNSTASMLPSELAAANLVMAKTDSNTNANAAYNGVTSGTAAELLLQVNTAKNWVGTGSSNRAVYTLGQLTVL